MHDPNQDCCNGQCYNINTHKCCTVGETDHICEIDDICCEAPGNCCDPNITCCEGKCCDPDTEFCCDGTCCDTETKCCDNGTCTPKCENGEPTGQCDTSYNEECIGCTLVPYTCSDFRMREYYGNEVHYCTGGCPGDCVQQNAVECYVEYECKKGSVLFMHACGVEPDPNLILCGAGMGGGGEGVACVQLDLSCPPWWCSPCVKNTDAWVIEYVYPRECQ